MLVTLVDTVVLHPDLLESLLVARGKGGGGMCKMGEGVGGTGFQLWN